MLHCKVDRAAAGRPAAALAPRASRKQLRVVGFLHEQARLRQARQVRGGVAHAACMAAWDSHALNIGLMRKIP
jgi:hypothetical protein